jgi:hypothetical protein
VTTMAAAMPCRPSDIYIVHHDIPGVDGSCPRPEAWIFAQLHDGDLRDMMFSTLVSSRSLSTTPRERVELARPSKCFWTHLRNVLYRPDIADHHYDFFHSGGRAVQPLRARAAREVLHDADVFKSRLISLGVHLQMDRGIGGSDLHRGRRIGVPCDLLLQQYTGGCGKGVCAEERH